ncbi:MAG TPA: outer membrane beta-barrel domain-containing protein [Steroidobacteraceae bacterium]|jgi:outer membrane beta-barrel protein|nr:outer membrane beta-barrel domain-containing protein [Steroidobacteraceae bacterium]
MEIRIRILLLASLLSLTSGCATMHRLWPWHRHVDAQVEAQKADAAADAAAAAADTAAPPTVIEPQVVRRKIKVPKIKAKNIEIGANYGEISIESYTAAPVWGITADYHITEDFFFEAAGGRAQAGQTSFETLSGDIQLLTNDERQFTYYNLSVGYNFLPGEVFLGRNHALTSAFYILGGMGAVKFEGNSTFAANFGAGFRVLPTDWLAIRIEAQDLVFKSDFLGRNRLRNNLKAYIGASVYF